MCTNCTVSCRKWLVITWRCMCRRKPQQQKCCNTELWAQIWADRAVTQSDVFISTPACVATPAIVKVVIRKGPETQFSIIFFWTSYCRKGKKTECGKVYSSKISLSIWDALTEAKRKFFLESSLGVSWLLTTELRMLDYATREYRSSADATVETGEGLRKSYRTN